MSHYKLIYFPIRGKGEAIRYLLALSGTSYEDVRIPEDKWPDMKGKTPMGQLPVLEMDGEQFCQSMTILRFLAKKFGLVPDNDLDAARAEMLADGIYDLYSVTMLVPTIAAICAGDEVKRKECWSTFKNTKLRAFLDIYENTLKRNGTGFLVGNKLTWTDVVVAEMMDRFATVYDTPTVLSWHPNLVKLMNIVHDLPNIKKYVATRPHAERLSNICGAQKKSVIKGKL